MQVVKNENTVFVDVDDTILMWDEPKVPGPHKIKFQFADGHVYLTPHDYHRDLIKMYRLRGYCVVVWSANGYDHAARAVGALGLEADVDFVMCKPSKHLDDNTDAASILGPRVYCANLTKPA